MINSMSNRFILYFKSIIMKNIRHIINQNIYICMRFKKIDKILNNNYNNNNKFIWNELLNISIYIYIYICHDLNFFLIN